jgi:phospholipase C
MNQQIFGTTDPPTPHSLATMSGFVANYAASPPSRAVMHYFTPEQVPVIGRLARQFAVCDQWHASAPFPPSPSRRPGPRPSTT